MKVKDATEVSCARFNTLVIQSPTSGVPYAELLDTQPWNAKEGVEDEILTDIKHGTHTERKTACLSFCLSSPNLKVGD